MAHPHAIAATATALLHRLARDCPRSAFLSEPTFSLRHLAGPWRNVPAEGLTVWVWRIQPASTATRSPPINAPDGGLRPPDLAVDLSILVSVRAAEAEQELRLAGWLLRWLADHPVLTPELLGLSPASTAGESFRAGESLTLLVDTLSPEDRHQLAAVDGGQWMGAVPCAVKGLRLEHVTTESKPR